MGKGNHKNRREKGRANEEYDGVKKGEKQTNKSTTGNEKKKKGRKSARAAVFMTQTDRKAIPAFVPTRCRWRWRRRHIKTSSRRSDKTVFKRPFPPLGQVRRTCSRLA